MVLFFITVTLKTNHNVHMHRKQYPFSVSMYFLTVSELIDGNSYIFHKEKDLYLYLVMLSGLSRMKLSNSLV